MKGIFEFEIGGQKRGFKFGTFAFCEACEKEGDIDLNTLFKRCGFPYKDDKGNLKADKARPKSLLHLFYGAALQSAKDNKRTVDFEVSDIGSWMDELGEAKLMEMINESFFQYTPKNSESPAKTGEPVLQ